MIKWLKNYGPLYSNLAISLNVCTWRKLLVTQNWDILTRVIFAPNVHWWVNQSRSWLLRAHTFLIIWIYQSNRQWLSFPSYNARTTWKYDDKRYQINSLSLVNLVLLIIKFSFICEGQPCRVLITIINKFQYDLNQNTTIFIPEYPFENIILKLGVICLGLNLSLPY